MSNSPKTCDLGVFYVSTYEGVRHVLAQKQIDSRIRALVAGGSASLVGQTIIVPFDVISQHLMMMGVQNKGSSSVSIHFDNNLNLIALL